MPFNCIWSGQSLGCCLCTRTVGWLCQLVECNLLLKITKKLLTNPANTLRQSWRGDSYLHNGAKIDINYFQINYFQTCSNYYSIRFSAIGHHLEGILLFDKNSFFRCPLAFILPLVFVNFEGNISDIGLKGI